MRHKLFVLLFAGILFSKIVSAQHEVELRSINADHLTIASVLDNNGHSFQLNEPAPLVDFELDGKIYISSQPEQWQQKLSLIFEAEQNFSPGVKGKIVFKNISQDTITVSNVVPFGRSNNKIFITGKGDN